MSHLHLLVVAGRDRDVLLQAGRLSGGEDLAVPLQDQLLLQVHPQHVGMFPLLVRQVGQHRPRGLKAPPPTSSHSISQTGCLCSPDVRIAIHINAIEVY